MIFGVPWDVAAVYAGCTVLVFVAGALFVRALGK